MDVVVIKQVCMGINMSLIPPGCEAGAYVPKRAYDELKEQYDNLLYASQRLAESKRTKPDRQPEDLSGVRAEVQ